MRTLLGIGLAGTTIGDTLFLEVIPKSQRGRWMMALGLFWVRDVWGAVEGGAVEGGGGGNCSVVIRPSSTPMHDIPPFFTPDHLLSFHAVLTHAPCRHSLLPPDAGIHL